MTVGRILICTRCDRDWDVIELPREFIDPRLYVCPEHRKPVDNAEQLHFDEDLVGLRVDRIEYDPAMAELPL